jgi:phosphohistidine phosphatase
VFPELVLCSSAVRTVATLDGFRDALPATTTVEVEEDLYGADVDELLARVRQVPDAVRNAMLIGHNPGMEDLALLLTGDGDRHARAAMASKFPTAAMAHLRVDGGWSELVSGAAYLEDFWTPR